MLGSWPKGFHKFAHNKTKSLPKLGLLMLVHHTHTHRTPTHTRTHMSACSAMDEKGHKLRDRDRQTDRGRERESKTDKVYIQFPG